MSNIFKNYKQLYKTELSNRKLYEERYKEIYDENIAYQMEIKKLKKAEEQKARLTLELEDTKGFLAQETAAKKELLKQRTELRKKITKLGGTWKDEK